MADLREDPITESYFDRHLHRPLAARVVGRVPRLPEASRIARAALVVGLTGAAAVLLTDSYSLDWMFPAWLLFAFTIASRCCRIVAPERAAAGVVLDFVVGTAFWLALTLRCAPTMISAVVLGGAVLLGALVQVGLYAQIRGRFLAFTTEPDPGEAAPEAPAGAALFLHGFGAALAHDLGALVLGHEHLGPLPPRGAARSILAGPMRMATILGSDTHLALVYVATPLAAIRLDLSLWTVAAGVLVGLNVWALLVVSAWRRAEALVRRLAPA